MILMRRPSCSLFISKSQSFISLENTSSTYPSTEFADRQTPVPWLVQGNSFWAGKWTKPHKGLQSQSSDSRLYTPQTTRVLFLLQGKNLPPLQLLKPACNSLQCVARNRRRSIKLPESSHATNMQGCTPGHSCSASCLTERGRLSFSTFLNYY